ncbi:uncharacterized protein KRP23_12234 [Phytophthora ramorum]|uniref:uncharacterized protein n=1 Tax=Phytophthora ramorum TaxID=164328 RepID=UPI00309BE004|nr:hypothetical protein KRP23_12232 [Phytophthora ramorum]KAH7465694.1 hypothetical protein KRP23_12234 [Phytophthora ramorum]
MVLESEAPEGDKDTAPLTFQMQVQLKRRETVHGVELHYAGLKDSNVLPVKEKLVSLAQRPGGGDNKDLRADKDILLESFAIVEVDAATFKEYDDVVLDVLFNEAAASSSADVVKTSIDSLITEKLAEYSQQFDDRFEQAFPIPRSCST